MSSAVFCIWTLFHTPPWTSSGRTIVGVFKLATIAIVALVFPYWRYPAYHFMWMNHERLFDKKRDPRILSPQIFRLKKVFEQLQKCLFWTRWTVQTIYRTVKWKFKKSCSKVKPGATAQPRVAPKSLCLRRLFMFPPDIANYLVNVSVKYQFIYFETPKVACSTIKKTLQNLEIEGTDKLLPSNVHNKADSSLQSPSHLQKPLFDYFPSFFKFSFVRNPYSRILSCYLDKIAGNQWEREIRLPKLGFEPNAQISFVEFLNAVKKMPCEQMDFHWMPQYYLLGTDKIDLDFIGRHETFALDFVKVLTKIKQQPVAPEAIINESWHRVGAESKLSQYINIEAIALIKEIYYEDFKHFGYGFDPETI